MEINQHRELRDSDTGRIPTDGLGVQRSHTAHRLPLADEPNSAPAPPETPLTPRSPPLVPRVLAFSPSPYALASPGERPGSTNFPPEVLSSIFVPGQVHASLGTLEAEIGLISSKIDELRRERDALKVMIQQENLYGVFEGTFNDAGSSISGMRPTTPESQATDGDGTEPMEMASPVQDTILSLSMEPHSIPLPPSRPSSPPSSSVGASSLRRVEALEEALHTARREVDEREIVLGDLRRNILAIQMRLPNNDSPSDEPNDQSDDHNGNARPPP